jgi:hypothetical protein
MSYVFAGILGSASIGDLVHLYTLFTKNEQEFFVNKGKITHSYPLVSL